MARVGQKQVSPTWGKCPSAGKQHREQFALFLPRQSGPPIPLPVCQVMETAVVRKQTGISKLCFGEIILTEYKIF